MVIVSGVPRMCMRMHVQPSFAIVGSISGSTWPADTSLMMLAPAAIPAVATDARYVSTEMVRLENEGSERRSFIVGRMRESSSSGEI